MTKIASLFLPSCHHDPGIHLPFLLKLTSSYCMELSSQIVLLISWHGPEHPFDEMIERNLYACVDTAYFSIIPLYKLANRTLLRKENSALQSHI